jgi:hypothetical protein
VVVEADEAVVAVVDVVAGRNGRERRSSDM